MKKGKNITIFYNPNKYWEIDCVEGNVFTLVLGILFLITSFYGILI
ncbi:MAG: hypothetical protein IJO33_03770 [Bacilli bacterium]|nr:hypothetical protein [Bacilli bacterium]